MYNNDFAPERLLFLLWVLIFESGKGFPPTSTLSSSAIGRENYLLLFLLSLSVLIFNLNLFSMLPLCI